MPWKYYVKSPPPCIYDDLKANTTLLREAQKGLIKKGRFLPRDPPNPNRKPHNKQQRARPRERERDVDIEETLVGGVWLRTTLGVEGDQE